MHSPVGDTDATTEILDRRARLWVALSDLYLDTELQPVTHAAIARAIITTGYSLEEARRIDREEVFPILHGNLLSVAGQWAGFDDDWLIYEVTAANRRRGGLGRKWNTLLYACWGSMTKTDWWAIEAAYLSSVP